MRLFSDNNFIANARVQISEQIKDCAKRLLDISSDILKLENKENFSEINSSFNHAKLLFDTANQMLSNIENFLLTQEFPTSKQMQESIKNTQADISLLNTLDEYKNLSASLQEKFAFVVSNYELISKILDSSIELCTLLDKAIKNA